jgi:hypothetical protein
MHNIFPTLISISSSHGAFCSIIKALETDSWQNNHCIECDDKTNI